MLLIFDTSVSERELISCQTVCVSCVQHVIKCVSPMTLSFMFIFYDTNYVCFTNFMCNLLLFRACNVILFFGLLFMY